MFYGWLKKSYIQTPIYFILFFILALLIKPIGLDGGLLTLLSVASFLFGFYIAYAINRAKDRHKSVLDQLRSADGLFINCKIQMEVFDDSVQKEFIKKVDYYLTTSVDYKLIDTEKSSPEFFEIIDYVTNLKTKNDRESQARANVIGELENLSEKRTILEILAKDKISRTEWIVIISLFLILLYFLYNISIVGFSGYVIKSVLATTFALLLILLSKFDNLSWKENRWIWEPLSRTFRTLGLLPYYGDFMFKLRRAKRPTDGPYRVAHYNKPYPEVKDKVVKIVNPKKR